MKSVSGSWKLSTLGGDNSTVTWRKNPQFQLNGAAEKTVLSVFIPKPAKSTTVGFTVLSNAGGSGFQTATVVEGKSTEVVSASSNKVEGEEIRVQQSVDLKSTESYTVFVWTTPARKGDFVLKTSAGTLEPIKSPYYGMHFAAQSTSDTSEKEKQRNFSQNPGHFFHLAKKGTAIFIVGYDKKPKGAKLGFTIVKCGLGKTDLSSVAEADVVLQEKPADSAEVYRSKQLEGGYYAVVPTGATASASYNLLILCKQELQKMQEEDDNFKVLIKPEDKKKTKRTKTTSPKNKTKKPHDESDDDDKEQEQEEEEEKVPQLTEEEKEAKAGIEMANLKLKEQQQQLNLLRQQLKENREVYAKDRKEWTQSKLSLMGKSDTLRVENKKLITDLNKLKQNKNESEEKLWTQIEQLSQQVEQYQLKMALKEDGIDWEQPIVSTSKRGDDIFINGEWKGPSAGGCLNHMTWRFNPQIFFTLEKNAKITFQLYQPKNRKNEKQQEELLPINFYVFKSFTPIKKRIVLPSVEDNIVCEAYFSSQKPSRVSASATLGATSKTPSTTSPCYYVVVPCTFFPGHDSKFSLNIKVDGEEKGSSGSVEASLINPATDEWPLYSGEWKGATSGGCLNFPSFLENPQYLIEPKKTVHLQFFLMQTEKPQETFDTMSIYILKAKPGLTQKIYEYKPALELKHANFTHTTQVVVDATLVGGESYVIIPCTFNPGFEANFQLRIVQLRGDNIGEIPAVKALPPTRWVTVKGSWTPDTAGGTINNKLTWRKNKQYSISLKKSIPNLDIVLTQNNNSNNSSNNNDNLFGIGFVIFEGNGKAVETLETPVLFKSQYKPDRQITETVSLDGPRSYTLVPTTFHANECCTFTLQATVPNDYTNGTNYVKIEEIPN